MYQINGESLIHNNIDIILPLISIFCV